MKFVTGSDLQQILSSDESKICLYVMSDPKEHSVRNILSCLYVKTSDSEYYTSFDHPDYPQQSYNELVINKAFVFDIKQLMNLGVTVQNCFDLKYFISETENNLMNFYRVKLNGISKLNSVIPIYSHLEHFQETAKNSILDFLGIGIKEFSNYKDVFSDKSLKFYHDVLPHVFSTIERRGVPVSDDRFLESFGDDKKSLIHESTVYTNYNYYTATGRPSNAFGGVNYAALNKSDDSKLAFVSRYDDGMLLNIDFKSYHLFLIANKLGIELPEDPHSVLGKQYFNSTELTDEQYDESKLITFRNLYGYQLEDIVKDIPFFNKVELFQDEMWSFYTTNGFVYTDLGKKIQVIDPSKNKVFNYYIQALETETNVKQMFDLIKVGLVPILYTYDSMVFDIKRNELQETTDVLNNILMFPFSISYGDTLKF